MAIDINKIIQESVQDTLIDNDEIKPINESQNQTDELNTSDVIPQENTNDDFFDPAAISAISAGLGSLTFRNHYRALKESANQNSRFGKKSKIAAGTAAGTAAGAAYLSRGDIKPGSGEKSDWDASNITNRLKRGYKAATKSGNIKPGSGDSESVGVLNRLKRGYDELND